MQRKPSGIVLCKTTSLEILSSNIEQTIVSAVNTGFSRFTLLTYSVDSNYILTEELNRKSMR